MTVKENRVRTVAAVLAASVPAVLVAQQPVPTDIELPAERRTPAEQRAAAYNDPDWTAPRTSWGHPSLDGIWSTDDMRGIPRNRPEELGTQEFLDEAQFLERAMTQQAGRNRAVNEETFLRNEWGTRTFGFTSLVVDPPDGRTPPLNEAGRAQFLPGGAPPEVGSSGEDQITLIGCDERTFLPFLQRHHHNRERDQGQLLPLRQPPLVCLLITGHKFIRVALGVDRLLVAGLIEARSCERFDLLRRHIKDKELADFYDGLFESEARHHSTYVRLAKDFDEPENVHQRLEELAALEAEIIRDGEELPRMHS